MSNLLKVMMFVSLLVLFIGCFIACSKSSDDDVNKTTQGSEDSLYEEDPVTQVEEPDNIDFIPNEEHELFIEVEPSIINVNEIPQFIKITVHNNSAEIEYRGGYHYSIEFHNDSEWSTIFAPMADDDEAVIEPNGKLEIKALLAPDNYRLNIGQYRVKYSVWYGEFSISR